MCDPACGSGHFLLAAARRIGREIARIDAGESEPGPELARAAIREAIAHCVYGVDLNPLAVDLCKLALWLEAHEPGKPIGFLDHHIRHGNALIGAHTEVMAEGVPDDVFEPVTGDDKKFAAAVKKRNRQERLNLGYDLLGQSITVFRSEDEAASYFRTMDQADDSLDAVAAKEQEFQRRSASADAWRARIRADLWTAAAFWPLQAGEPEAPTQSTWLNLAGDPRLIDYLRPDKRTELQHLPAFKTVRMARQLARQHSFFHWQLEFPDVFTLWDSGFDCILGNPPWERIKLQEQEFFAARNEEIAKAPNAAARKKLIAELERSDDPRDRKLFAEFEIEKRKAEGESTMLRKSGVYPLTGRGDVNTYSVFAERMAELVGEAGRAGVIVPTGIATDDTNKHFFGWLVDEGRIASLYDFENREKLFEEVDSRMKFSLLTLTGASRPSAPFRVGFFLTQPNQIGDPERTFELDAATIALLNPNTKTCPIFRTQRDADLTKKIYRAAPVLIREDEKGNEISNPWGISFKRMFDMSNDSHLFRTRQQLEDRGLTLAPDGRFRNAEETWLPLYEAKMIHQYDHRFATYEPDGTVRDVTLAEHQDPSFFVLPRYWVPFESVVDGAGREFENTTYLAFRLMLRSTDAHSMFFSVVPSPALGHSGALVSTLMGTRLSLCVAANANTFTMEYVVRNKLGGANLSFFIVKQLPFLSPNAYSESMLERISQLAFELGYSSSDVQQLANSIGYGATPFRWDPNRREIIRAELDGLFAHLYGITKDNYSYILDTFPIIERQDRNEFGEYRTKRLCLEAYDRFAVTMEEFRDGTYA